MTNPWLAHVRKTMSEHPGIKAISFTGGTKTGETIAKTAAPMFKKLSFLGNLFKNISASYKNECIQGIVCI